MQPPILEQEKVIHALLKMDVVRVAQHQPFFYTNGWASPVYIDLRGLLSQVGLRNEVIAVAVSLVQNLINANHINAIVGTEGSGVVFAAWLADKLQLPMLYLRRRPIGWGMGAQLEGSLPPKARVLLVDDVTTDGRSKVDACLALQKLGAVANDALVLVNFDIYPQTQQLQLAHAIALHSLITWPALCQALFQSNKLTTLHRQTIEDFNRAPVEWSLKHSGVGQC
jgi:orotate phosphoribosyltransferase